MATIYAQGDSMLHHRSGDLEKLQKTRTKISQLHHRSGDLEIIDRFKIIRYFLHHRSGDLEIAPTQTTL